MRRSVRVLAVVPEEEVYGEIARSLPDEGYELSRTPSSSSAVLMARLVRFELLLVPCPPPELARQDFLAALRQPGSASSQSPVLFFRTASTCETPGCAGPGSCYLVDPVSSELAEALAATLGPAARRSDRILVEATFEASSGARSSRLLQTRDVSTSGLFVVTRRRLPIGTRLELSLRVPTEPHPIRASAEVVRRSSERERTEGIGVRFVGFEGEDAKRLETYLSGHSRPETSSPRSRNGLPPASSRDTQRRLDRLC